MHENNMKLINIILSLVIIFLTVFITHRFIPSLAWAGVIVIATYPLYRRWRKLFGKHQNLSAFLFTLILALILFLPLSWLVHVLVKEMQIFVSYKRLIAMAERRLTLFVNYLLLEKRWFLIGMLTWQSLVI